MSSALLRSALSVGTDLGIAVPTSRDLAKSRREPSRRVAIVGAGFGGLAAAIRLQAAGMNTVIYEARDKAGGCAYVYEQDGYVFDGGPTIITAPTCLEELFSLAGRRMQDYVELLPVHPMYRLSWEDGTVIDYDVMNGLMEREIARIAPSDIDGYRRFEAYAKRVFETGYTPLADKPFLRLRDMVKVAPKMVRLRSDRSVYDTVARFVKDEHVRQALSFHSLLVGGNPFETSSIYTLIHHLERNWGVFFPRGGTGALVRALVRLYEELGGELRLSSPVESIDVDEHKGRVSHRIAVKGLPSERFDWVVSNADLHQTYARFYRDHPAAATRARKLERMDWSMSLFVLYFGTRRKYPGLAHHTILFGPRYRELLDDIFKGCKLPDDFSLYLHAPTVTDPSLAPPGGESFYVLSPVPHLGRANIDWETVKHTYAEKILTSLERQLPGLRQDIVTKRMFTPSDFQDTLGTWQGSSFSVAPRLLQSAYFRPHNRDGKIPGLYLVGSGTHPGAGVPGVINSAKATARTLLADAQKARVL
ncbi:MAG TPA: phytoene desaturase [Polyangia bacterium]